VATYHHILGTNEDSTKQEVKIRYRQLSSQYHPDKKGSAELFKLINEAYKQVNNGRGNDEAFNSDKSQYTEGPAHIKQIAELLDQLEKKNIELAKAEKIAINERDKRENIEKSVNTKRKIFILILPVVLLAFFFGAKLVENETTLEFITKPQDSMTKLKSLENSSSQNENDTNIEKNDHDGTRLIVSAFKKQDRNAISALIYYPLNRKYPIPSINNEEELISRFDEVFDENLIQLIANSDLNKDWDRIGSRGVMLFNGLVWQDSGKIIAINYQSVAEKAITKNIIENQKQSIHPSLRDYKQPILEWNTARFHIRIDDIGEYKYRYSAWRIGKKTSDEPDLILFNGKQVFEGSGGNHHYTFTAGKYIYRCSVNIIGKSSIAGTLDVFNGSKHLLSEKAVVSK
jgi:curved DNA-binding protein CbpA